MSLLSDHSDDDHENPLIVECDLHIDENVRVVDCNVLEEVVSRLF
jgi:hypothetical protein